MVSMNDAEIIRCFFQGIACAKADGECPVDEVYNCAIDWVCNDYGVRRAWVDELLAIYFDVNGYPEVW